MYMMEWSFIHIIVLIHWNIFIFSAVLVKEYEQNFRAAIIKQTSKTNRKQNHKTVSSNEKFKSDNFLISVKLGMGK